MRCVWNYNFRKRTLIVIAVRGVVLSSPLWTLDLWGAFTKLYGISAIHLDPIWVIGFSEMESALDKLKFGSISIGVGCISPNESKPQ